MAQAPAVIFCIPVCSTVLWLAAKGGPVVTPEVFDMPQPYRQPTSQPFFAPSPPRAAIAASRQVLSLATATLRQPESVRLVDSGPPGVLELPAASASPRADACLEASGRTGKRRPRRNAGARRRYAATSRQDSVGPTCPLHGGANGDGAGDLGDESLRSQLNELEGVDSSRIFLVRKVQQFGFDSPSAMRTHFSAYGDVQKVLVAHPTVMSGSERRVRRIRPANMAIVVMADAAVVEALHRAGTEHVVRDCAVLVECYRRRGEEPGGKAAEFNFSISDVARSNTSSCDAVSTGDGLSMGDNCSLNDGESCEEEDDEDVFISGEFEFVPTDDEWC